MVIALVWAMLAVQGVVDFRNNETCTFKLRKRNIPGIKNISEQLKGTSTTIMVDPIFLAVAGLTIALAGTILLLLWFSGMFTSVDVGSGKSPFGKMKIAYKFNTGPYKDCGPLFTEAMIYAPSHRSIGIYYDDPKTVDSEKCRYIVGVILTENDEEPDTQVENKLVEKGFKLFNIPAIEYAVKTSFPYVWDLSIYIAIWKVYSKLGKYVEERKLSARPAIEIYDSRTIYFFMPLSKQDDFYVTEVAEDTETEDQQPDSSPDKLLAEATSQKTDEVKESGSATEGEKTKEKEDSGGESSSSFEQLEPPKENE